MPHPLVWYAVCAVVVVGDLRAIACVVVAGVGLGVVVDGAAVVVITVTATGALTSMRQSLTYARSPPWQLALPQLSLDQDLQYDRAPYWDEQNVAGRLAHPLLA